ncbi:hypothetical protein FI667_g4527, partial [Globisporangium splendens]
MQVSTQSSTWRTVLVFMAFVTAAATFAFQLAAFKSHYDAHVEKHRVLRDLQEFPSLQLHFSIKRSSMHVHGASEFGVFANPVVGGDSGISYNGIATFVESDVVHKYILGAVNAATPAASVVSTVNIDCPSGKLFKLSFSGDDYALCSTLASGASGFKIFGSDFDVEVSSMSTPASITKPTLSEEVSASCEAVPESSTTTTSTMELLKSAVNDITTRALKAEETEVTMASSSCGCKGKKRACIFIPGRGSDLDNGLQDSNSYFANIKDHAPCCSSVRFAIINTNAYGWNDASLQQKTCNLALRVSNSSNIATKTIEDTIVIAHSMGNMILGGAIANGVCKLGVSSSWVALSPPMKGSMAANLLQDACAGKLSGIVKSAAKVFGQCPTNAATIALSYQGEVCTSTAVNAQYSAAQAAYKQYVTAAMCSDDYAGLLSVDKVKYALGGSVIPHKSKENDSIVEYQSCAAGLSTSQFGNSYSSKFYVTKLNHADTAFRHGDALFNNAQKPMKWFECLL